MQTGEAARGGVDENWLGVERCWEKGLPLSR